MPLYVLGCGHCGAETEIFRRIADIDKDLPTCCGMTMERIICAPSVVTDIPAYKSMMTGEMIEGRKQHRDHQAAHNVIEVGNDLDNYKPPAAKPDTRLKETIARQVYEKLSY